MLFCQPKRTFSCSRVLLFSCSPHRTIVKNVVKTRTSKKPKWSPKNRSKHHDCGSSLKQKTGREKHNVVSPKAANPNMWSRKPKLRGQAMWSKAFESREVISHLKGFFFRWGCIVTLVKGFVKALKSHFRSQNNWEQ